MTTIPIRFIDAWTLVVSAMTATGSTSIDITQVCTPLGYALLIVLLHVGGVGFMSITLSLLQQFGVRVFRMRRVSGWRLFWGALAIEVWVTMMLALSPHTVDTELWQRFGTAFWRASTAFANVGFPSLTDPTAVAADIPSVAVLAITMLLGSLGLPVLVDLVTRNKKMPQTSVNVLITGAFIAGGAGAIILNPLWHVTHTGLSGFEKGFLAFNEALTWRTSGYIQSSDIMTLSVGTRIMLLVGMFLGCAPGAMGGGITPTTFAVFVSGVARAVRGDQAVTLMGQRIAPLVIHRAVLIVAMGIAIVLLCTAGLLLIDGLTIAQAVMMATAAFATSNVAVVPYAQLHPASLAMLSIAMLWGRVGVFAIVLSLYGRATPKSIHAQNVWLG
jgi:trk system potassium uptake protein TrkH